MSKDSKGSKEKDRKVSLRLTETEYGMVEALCALAGRRSPRGHRPTVSEALRMAIYTAYAIETKAAKATEARDTDDDAEGDLPEEDGEPDDTPLGTMFRKESRATYRFRGSDVVMMNIISHAAYAIRGVEACMDMCMSMAQSLDSDERKRVEKQVTSLNNHLGKASDISSRILSDYMDSNKIGMDEDEGYRIL